jgi:hypothetical protein
MLGCNNSLVTAMKLKCKYTFSNREAAMLLVLPYILQQCLNKNRTLVKALLPIILQVCKLPMYDVASSSEFRMATIVMLLPMVVY